MPTPELKYRRPVLIWQKGFDRFTIRTPNMDKVVAHSKHADRMPAGKVVAVCSHVTLPPCTKEEALTYFNLYVKGWWWTYSNTDYGNYAAEDPDGEEEIRTAEQVIGQPLADMVKEIKDRWPITQQELESW